MYGRLVSGGIGQYTAMLISELEKLDHENQYFIFVSNESKNHYTPKAKNFKKILAPFHWYGRAEQINFPRFLNKYDLDLMHFPNFNVPYLYRGKFIVTIHDLIPFKPGYRKSTTLGPVKYRTKKMFLKINTTSLLKRAQKIITVSQNSKNDIVDIFGVKPEKVVVTYEAPYVISGSRAVDDKKIKNKYNIGNKFLLYVGNALEHKNLRCLILAFQELYKNHNDLQLVLVGKKNFFYEKLEKKMEHRGLNKGVVYYGLADEEELAWLYQNAKLYVFPSLYEGFGLPPLEAMQQGLPVASSNKSCMPEILGEAASYFDPTNIDEMVKIIEKGLRGGKSREDLINKGYKKVKEYSWPRMARETLDIYKT